MPAAADAGVPEAEGLVVGGGGEDGGVGAGGRDGVHDGGVAGELGQEGVALDVDDDEGTVGGAGGEVVTVEGPLEIENGVVVKFEG